MLYFTKDYKIKKDVISDPTSGALNMGLTDKEISLTGNLNGL